MTHHLSNIKRAAAALFRGLNAPVISRTFVINDLFSSCRSRTDSNCDHQAIRRCCPCKCHLERTVHDKGLLRSTSSALLTFFLLKEVLNESARSSFEQVAT